MNLFSVRISPRPPVLSVTTKRDVRGDLIGAALSLWFAQQGLRVKGRVFCVFQFQPLNLDDAWVDTFRKEAAEELPVLAMRKIEIGTQHPRAFQIVHILMFLNARCVEVAL